VNVYAVKLLLAHPDIDIYCQNRNGYSALALAAKVLVDNNTNSVQDYNRTSINNMMQEKNQHKIFASLLVFSWWGKDVESMANI
jgi:hypothetical protein